MLTTVLGVYFGLFVSFTSYGKTYNFFTGRTREQDLAEEAQIMSKSEKLTQFVIVICIAAIITAVGNVMDGKTSI